MKTKRKERVNESDNLRMVIFRVVMAVDHGSVEYGSFPTYWAAVANVHEMARPILDSHPGSSMIRVAPKKAKFVVRAVDGTKIGGFEIIVRPGPALFEREA